MITNPEVSVDAKNKLPHGTVRRAPAGFAHAILLDQMGKEAKWQTIDLYGPMEIYTDAAVEDWPIVYMPAPDEVWAMMNSQLSYRDRVIEEFAKAPEGELQGPPETAERMYPISAFVIPCKNCDHKKWIHDNETGKCCHARMNLPGTQCGCSGFEDVPDADS